MAKRRESTAASAATNWTEEQARGVLDAWEKSGETGAAFARSIGVVAQRLFWWRRRLGGKGRSTPSFVPVVAMAPERPTAPLIVTTASGARIEVHDVDASTAAWVVAVLRERACS
jgi:hypothetical protein